MIKKLLNKVKKYFSTQPQSDEGNGKTTTVMPSDLQQRISHIKREFQHASDMVFREFEHATKNEVVKFFLFNVDGIADKDSVNNFILKPLMSDWGKTPEQSHFDDANHLFNEVKKRILTYGPVTEAKTYQEMVTGVLSGDTALLIDNYPVALLVSTRKWEARSVAEPESEPVVRGPHEGFVESLRTNTSLIRRKLKTSKLKFEALKIGIYSGTDIAIAYLEGVADPEILQEVKKRLEQINIDGILESGYLEELIEDNPYSPFPQIEHTERPDKVAGSLLEGRIAIITDGTPLVLIVPVVFWSFLQASEDYYERYLFSSFTRSLRVFATLISLVGPSVYIAVITYHQEMLPTGLLISIAAQREGVPFPAVIEALLLEFAFEVLREGGIRLPRPVGQAVSIVGALIIGQAAVQAGLVSASMVIVVALTGIASFTIPTFSVGMTFRLLRFPLMVAASLLGFYGVMLGMLTILTHMCSLRSFGVPYLSPVAPLHFEGLKDVAIRSPWWRMLRRPKIFQRQNIIRQRPARGSSK